MKSVKLSLGEASAVCTELAAFLHAGLSPASAFALMAKQTKEKALARVFENMGKACDKGAPLSQSVKESSAFPDAVHLSLSIGEKTGRTEETLSYCARYLSSLDETDSRLRAALLYPLSLITVMLSVGVLLLAYVLPVFRQVYDSVGGAMSEFAKGLLFFGDGLRSVMPLLAALLIFIVFALCIFSASQTVRNRLFGFFGKGKKRGAALLLEKARFANALSLCLAGGLDVSSAIQSASLLLSDSESRKKCALSLKLLDGGAPLGDALFESGLLDAPEARLIDVGIKAGNADGCALAAAKRLDKKADDALTKTAATAEPICVIISCLLVGSVILAVMLPLSGIMASMR